MHKFSTAPTKSSAVRCAPPALHSVGLLNVPYSTFAGASVARLVRSALSSLRDENLCIIRAKSIQSMCIHCSRQKMGADVNDANATGFQLSIYFISVLKISGTKGWLELSPPGHIDVFGRPDQKIDSPL